MKFREIWKASNRTAALTYFRNLVDRHRYGEPERLKETLGLRYNPKYENLLELIPYNQFDLKQRTVLKSHRDRLAVDEEPTDL